MCVFFNGQGRLCGSVSALVLMMYLFLGQFSKCGLSMTHTGVILVCDDGGELFRGVAHGEMGD